MTALVVNKATSNWRKLTPPGEGMITQDIVSYSKKAERVLDANPEKGTPLYTKTQQDHYGQYGTPLLSCFAAECNLACSLHDILAVHCQMWKAVDQIVICSNRSHQLSAALRAAGADYMGFQVGQYNNSKRKHYDGSEKIKMTGEDCRLLKMNIDKFVKV